MYVTTQRPYKTTIKHRYRIKGNKHNSSMTFRITLASVHLRTSTTRSSTMLRRLAQHRCHIQVRMQPLRPAVTRAEACPTVVAHQRKVGLLQPSTIVCYLGSPVFNSSLLLSAILLISKTCHRDVLQGFHCSTCTSPPCPVTLRVEDDSLNLKMLTGTKAQYAAALHTRALLTQAEAVHYKIKFCICFTR